MRIIPVLIAVTALPLMALAQEQDKQKDATQGQTNEPQKAAPAKKAKAHAHVVRESSQAQARPETGARMHRGAKAEARTEGARKTEVGTRSTSKTKTKVTVEEFKSRHREVFTLGRHPREFFVHRFGANHFRLIGNTYFVFEDGCWVAVDVAGFTFVERVICQGDPDYIVVY